MQDNLKLCPICHKANVEGFEVCWNCGNDEYFEI